MAADLICLGGIDEGEVFRPLLSVTPTIHPPAGWTDDVDAKVVDVALPMAQGATSGSFDTSDFSEEDLKVRIVTASGSPPHTPQVIDDRIGDHLSNAICSGEIFRADNSGLKAKTAGLGLRNSRSLTDMDKEGKLVTWGSLVCGSSTGDGWFKVGEKYLPKALDGAQVLFPIRHEEDTIAGQSTSPLSEATTVPDGPRLRRGRAASSGSLSSRKLDRPSVVLEKECEELKEQLQLARERLARLKKSAAVEPRETESEPLDIRDQTIEHLQKKLRAERQLAETARQELMQEFARERDQLNRELSLERSRRQHYQRLVEARRANEVESATQAVRVVQPSSHRSSSASSRSQQNRLQPSLTTTPTKAAVVIPTCGRSDVQISRSWPQGQLPIRLRSTSPGLPVDASPSRIAADNFASPIRFRSSSSQRRLASPGSEGSPLICSSRSISRGPAKVIAAPLPQPCAVQPSAIVYKHSPPLATNISRRPSQN